MVALEAVASALSYIALALFLGQLATAGFLLPRGEPAALRRSLVAGATSSLIVFVCVAVFALLIQGAKLQRGIPSVELLWRYLTMAQSGKVWLAREVYAAALALFLWRFARKDAGGKLICAATLLALPLVASRSLTSHAVAVREDAVFAVVSDALHLLATALWAGGLFSLWRIFCFAAKQPRQLPSWTATIVKRFSRLALATVPILFITGLYQSWVHVGSFSTLLTTDYGRVLVLKLFLFSIMLGIGALNFMSTKRLLVRAAGSGEDVPTANAKALQRTRVENLLGLLIFGATGLLTVLPPGVHAVHQTAPAPALTASKTDSALDKKYLLAEGAAVKILSPRGGEILTGDRVPLKFTFIRGKRGHHVHAYVDGELVGMFESKTGTLNGVSSGRHLLELRIVATDHQSELDAFDRVEFVVK